MMVLQQTLIVGGLLYFAAMVWLIFGLRRNSPVSQSQDKPMVSVIIAARNEQATIAACLDSVARQSYPNYEVIVVNDNSEDGTRAIAERYRDCGVRILDLPPVVQNISPKKAAIALAVEHSRGDIIVTTDADCVVPHRWLESMVGQFDPVTGAVSSWVVVNAGERSLDRIEFLDSLFYSAIGGGLIGRGNPVIASGANFAYRKELFIRVGGFNGSEHYASGDDDLFLQKLARLKEFKIKFNSSKDALVTTRPAGSVARLLSQRLRWGSKGPAYPSIQSLIQGAIYLFDVGLVVSLAGLLFDPLRFAPVFVALAIKLLADVLLFQTARNRLAVVIPWRHLIGFELFQIFYILVVGVGGLWGQFTWKGRRFVRGKVTLSAQKSV